VQTAAISGVSHDPEAAGQWAGRHQEEHPDALPAVLEMKRIGVFDEIDKQLLIVSDAAAALIDAKAYPGGSLTDAASLTAREIAVPGQSERWVSHKPRSGQELHLFIVISGLLIALGFGWFGGSNFYRYFYGRDGLTGKAAVNAVVERIIAVESNGNPNAKNSRSSAMGLGQFLDETWLDLVRAYRPDLARGRSESETLELRREPKLAREITTRFVERNVAMLRQRGLPVTAGTAYLAHFAGGAGAVAILSASENADAALVMASADSTGRTKRERLIKANPFLEHFTVANLKIWADRKMRGPSLRVTEVLAAEATQ
jgi:hypothetical protein